MKTFETLPFPKLDSQENLGHWPEFLLSANKKDDPAICAEAAIRQHKDQMTAGEIPGFTVGANLMKLILGVSLAETVDVLRQATIHESELDSTEDQAFIRGVARACFDAVNQLFGEAPAGRRLAHFEAMDIRRPGQYRAREGTAHIDSFNGSTVHVQRKVGGRGFREVKFGLRLSDEPIVELQQFDSVEEGATDPRIWVGTVRQGDITVLNSGLALPDGGWVSSVHQFATVMNDPNNGGKTVSFSQFFSPQAR